MGRSVSHASTAAWVLYTRLDDDDGQVFVCRRCGHCHYGLDTEPSECSECGNVGFTVWPETDCGRVWKDFVDNLRFVFKKALPSLHDCDRWLGSEDHAFLENGHAWIGVSEYCGLVSVWCVPKEDFCAGCSGLPVQSVATIAHRGSWH